MAQSYSFPRKFVWGVATAAAQIEGAAQEDGKGESIWDRFPQMPGKVFNNDGPETACDHYHRYPDDIALMKALGYANYRFSISWPRIYPTGRDTINERGLDFYDRLVDALLDTGITPWATLFHWDLPQALENEGGWRVRSTPEAFASYARIVVQRLGDRVKNWMTVNEMPCFIGLSYETGIHAPGAREPKSVVNQAYHHALLAHGHGVAAVREYGGKGAQVGVVHNPATFIPVCESGDDLEAAKSAYLRATEQLMGPLFLGGYTREWLKAAGADRPTIMKGDAAFIGQKTDFLGLNLYAGSFVRAAKNTGRSKQITPEILPWNKGFPTADLEWLKIVPQTLYWGVRHAYEVYGAQDVYITENGAAWDDEVTANGEVIDLGRREWMRNYLIGLHRAAQEGYKVRGYFAWSLMDNYEWAEGYAKRFGIVHVDYATQKRTPKLSAQWYSQVVRENRLV
jgi:beta-glucosidase